RVVATPGPNLGEVFVCAAPQQERSVGSGHALTHLGGHHGIGAGDGPATEHEPPARILVGSSGPLHNAVERNVVDDRDGAHQISPVSEPRGSPYSTVSWGICRARRSLRTASASDSATEISAPSTASIEG